jgi:hypothetical protein
LPGACRAALLQAAARLLVMVIIVAETIVAVFIVAVFIVAVCRQFLIYLFPRIECGPTARRVTFRSFGERLAALLSKKAAFQAIVLAFYRDNNYVWCYRVTAERIGLAANSAPD